MTMTMREIAQSLIQTVEGIDSDKNIDGVLQVFEGIKTGIDNKWEDYLYNNANEVLFVSKTTCKGCQTPIKITRTRSAVTVEKQ